MWLFFCYLIKNIFWYILECELIVEFQMHPYVLLNVKTSKLQLHSFGIDLWKTGERNLFLQQNVLSFSTYINMEISVMFFLL